MTGALVLALLLSLLVVPQASAGTFSETAGGAANTWSDYNSAGGTQGPTIGSNQTVQIACKVQGFRVQDGNTNWYRIAQDPWNNNFYVSADAFYNNGATSGSLAGTPFVDPAVPDCSSLPIGTNETAGGAANTWTDYNSAGGTQGPTIGAQQTVAIECKLTGFRVQDGNSWWYRVASAPWSSAFYVSADAFYNNGATSGSLIGTPFVDPAVPDCAGATGSGVGGTKPAPSVTLAQGPAAPAGFRYAIRLQNFAPAAAVSVRCLDSVSPSGFFNFTLITDNTGSAFTQSQCFSGDGPSHWVVAGGLNSNRALWGNAVPVNGSAPVAVANPTQLAPVVAAAPAFKALPQRCAGDASGQIVDKLSVTPDSSGSKITVRPGPKGKVSWYADNSKIAAATSDMWNIMVPCLKKLGFTMTAAASKTVYYQLNCHFYDQRFSWAPSVPSFGDTYDMETWRVKTVIPAGNLQIQGLYMTRETNCNWP